MFKRTSNFDRIKGTLIGVTKEMYVNVFSRFLFEPRSKDDFIGLSTVELLDRTPGKTGGRVESGKGLDS